MSIVQVNCQTGEVSSADYTEEELAAHMAAKAIEDAALDPDVIANKAIDADDKIRKLLFDLNFNQENRLRALEGKGAITKSQYRDALISAYKAL